MKKFKFNLGDRVYVHGHLGSNIVSGRGVMDFISGGKLNIYQVDGAHPGYFTENTLLHPKEFLRLVNEDKP